MQPDMQQVMSTSADAAMHAMASIMYVGSILSLMTGVLPMLWGQVRVKWLITALMSCVMFGLTALMMNVMAGPMTDEKPSATTTPPAPSREIDWAATGLLLLVVAGVIAAVMGIRKTIPLVRRRRAQAAERALARRTEQEEKAKARLQASDPAQVALAFAPDMADDVGRALERIALLKSVGDRVSRQEDADALVMIDRRMPSVMDLYLRASEVCTPEERAAAARTALGSIVNIGQLAEDTRQRIARDLRSDLDTESRYISSRTGRAYGLGLD